MTETEAAAPTERRTGQPRRRELGASRSIGCRPPASPARRTTPSPASGCRGPLQGFGQLWQKTFTVRLDGVDTTPEAVIATWKAHFAEFWPKGQRFYAPLSGITPGEVGLLEIEPRARRPGQAVDRRPRPVRR